MTNKISKTKIQKFPLRTTLVVPFVLQIVAAVGLVGYLSFRSGQQAVNDLATQLIDSATQRTNEHLDSYLALPHQINQLNAETIADGQLDLDNTSALQKHFWRQAKIFDSIGYLGFARTDGSEAGAGRWINGIDLLVFDSPLEGVSIDYLADDKGNPDRVVQTYEYDPRENGWYEDAVTAKKPIWSGVITGIASNLEMTEAGESLQQPEDQNSTLGINSFYVVAAARHPIYNADGNLKGILVTDLVLTEISKFLNKLQVSPGGQIFIVERDGTLVASSADYPVMGVVDEQSVRLNINTTEDPRLKAVSREIRQQFNGFKAIQAKQDIELEVDGENLFVEVMPWQDEYGLDWVLVVAVPESDFIDRTFVELNPGDGVVVYTDGIPEAFDMGKRQYGMEQFCETISHNWHRSAKEIEQAIIKDVRLHIGKQKVFDDITLVVFKRQATFIDLKPENTFLQSI